MSEPRPAEFTSFHRLLIANAPDEYEPWYFRVESGSKAPATSYGSWKDEPARLSPTEAVEWMESGGNVGIAGTAEDRLVNVDIDDEDQTTIEDLKQTLIARSRSRTGVHGWYFEAPGAEIPNIPTDEAGEVRTSWQYVVAPGSFVETDKTDVPDSEQKDAGYYTVERADPVSSLRLEELPEVFQDHQHPDPDEQEIIAPDELKESDSSSDNLPGGGTDSSSELFNIRAVDVIRREGGSSNPGDRWSSIFHSSVTGHNMSLSSEGLLHCWRHEVAHNGLQALSVLSDYSGDCKDVGAGHKRSGAGRSCLGNEDGSHIFHAWKYAKKNGYIPADDPVPYAALKHVCREREICPVSDIPREYDADDDRLPAYAYDGAIASIRNFDGLNPGRSQTDSMAEQETQETQETHSATQDNNVDQPEDETNGDWVTVYQSYGVAGSADERLPARFDATEILDDRQHWRSLVENDVLYHYDPDDGVYAPDGEIRLRETLVERLEEQYRSNEMREIAEQLRGRNMISQEEMGGPAQKVCTQNCVLDLSGEEVKTQSHDPSFEFLNRVETEYDESADCPRFRSFLEEVVQTGAQRKKLQEYAGYILHHWGLPYHKTLFLVGPTASGKSTFLDTIRSMLGSEAVASLTPQQMTEERFGGAELFGAWANIRNDIPSETVNNTGQFKEIAAGDPVKAEEKYQDPFHFEPKAKHMFSANQLPETNTDDEAFYRRILLCAFPNTIPRGERDPALDGKLEAELPGVLNWAIEGLQRLQIQGRFTADRIPGETQDTWEKWANSITRFRKIGLEDETGSAVPKSTAYAAYVAYCEAEGIPTETKHKMTRKLKKNDVQSGRRSIEGKQQRCYLDVELSSRGVDLLNLDSSETATGNGGGGIDDY